MSRWIAWALVGLSCILLAAPASAQSKGDKRKARKYLTTGDKELAAGDELMDQGKIEKAHQAYNAALRSYRRAHRAFPDAKIYFPIALAEQKLGHFLDALEHYNKMLEESGEELPEPVVEQVNANIEEVKKQLVAFDLSTEPKGASIAIDGKDIGKTPLDDPFWTVPGKHTVEITLEGHTTVKEDVDLTPGTIDDREIVLEEEKPEELEVVEPVVVEPPRPVTISNTPLYIGLAAAAVFAGGATYTGLKAVSYHRVFNDETRTQAERADAQDKGDSMALYTDLLLVGAIASAGYSAYYYLFYMPSARAKAKERAPGTANSSLWFAPYATAREAGVAAGFRF